MPFARPTLSTLRARIAADITSSAPGVDGLLRYTNLGVLGDLWAKGVSALFGYLDWIARQAVPFTATDEYLEGWAALRGVTRKAATPAEGLVTFTGPASTIIPAGLTLTRADGAAYSTLADVTLAGDGTGAAGVRATIPGAAGNTAPGASLSLGGAIAGVASTASALAGLSGGADLEENDDLRTRMLQAYSAAPQGGSGDDYVRWALGVAGVTRAWCRPTAMGPGTVVVYTMLDDANAEDGGFPQGIGGAATAESRAAPATEDLLAVADAIFPVQPVTALVYALSPQANEVSFTISLAGATTAVKSAIEAAIAGVLLREGAPGGELPLSYLETAIGAISGSKGFVITSVSCAHGSVVPGATGNVVSAAGYLPTPGAITWV